MLQPVSDYLKETRWTTSREMTGLTLDLHMQLHAHEHKYTHAHVHIESIEPQGVGRERTRRSCSEIAWSLGLQGLLGLPFGTLLEAHCGDNAFGLAPASAPPIILGLEYHPCMESFCGDHCQSQLPGSISFLFILLWGYPACVFFHVKAAISSDEIKCSLHRKLAL